MIAIADDLHAVNKDVIDDERLPVQANRLGKNVEEHFNRARSQYRWK